MKDKLDVLMRHYKYDEGIKKIARETKLSRNTVRDYIREFKEKRTLLISKDPNVDVLSIIDSIVEKPKYDSSTRTSVVMNEEFIQKIKEYIQENMKPLKLENVLLINIQSSHI